MSKDFVTVAEDTKVTSAAQLMKDKSSSCIVVSDRNKAVGIVTENDFVVRVLAFDKDPHTTELKTIMSEPLVYVDTETSILDAISIMHQKNFSQLPVIENGQLMGLVKLTDLMQCLVGFFSAHRW